MKDTFVYTYRVSYADTDQMKVVYYANYFIWFERARTEMLRSKGSSYKEFEKKGFFLPVSDAKCSYIKSARYDDIVHIHTKVEELRRASIIFAYEIIREDDGAIIAKGSTNHPFVNVDGKPMRVTQEIKQILGL
ncbi:MAG: thioesterase family protein [Elusimicrobiota bacterium]